MDGDSRVKLVVSLFLLAASAFFVAAEYGLISARRTKIEALAKKGNRSAKLLMSAFQKISNYVAGTQWGITLIGIVIGSYTEPWMHALLEPSLHALPASLVKVISILVVAFPLVVFGELIPKIYAIRYPERTALATVAVLRLLTIVLSPFVWLSHKFAALILRPLGIKLDEETEDAVSREEFAIMVQASQEEGHFEESQANVINKALKFDKLDTGDVMIHRLDIKWIDKGLDRAGLAAAMREIPHSRIPVCSADIDEIVGIAYLQDIVRAWDRPDFTLLAVTRPAIFVPENLTLDKVIHRMRESKTQILIVRDEYGGTAGLLTLEDVVEEVFGELEDSLESERPPLERVGAHRVTARADVRYDELLEFLDFEESESSYTTETLAEIVVNTLGRMPKLGDSVSVPFGTLRVENMARGRVTRIALLVNSTKLPGSS